jgi:hypothetical protein
MEISQVNKRSFVNADVCDEQTGYLVTCDT